MMSKKFKLGENLYSIDDLNEASHSLLEKVNFTTKKLQELKDIEAIMKRAKNTYLENLKKEVLTAKAGFLFEEN